MTLFIPEVSEVTMLQKILNQDLYLRLYSNNVTPANGDTAASYTEVAGGGYSQFTLTYANWTITGGNPTVALYSNFQDWNFTGTTNAPGTVYGYYVVQVSDGKLVYSERFPVVPFTPVLNSLIRIRPRFTGNTAA
jgi:hypothetical protein